MISRRRVLQGAGVLTVLAAAGAVYRATTTGIFSAGEGVAYEPWRAWSTEMATGPLALVRAGILASSAHNTQPWLFRVYPDAIELYADPARNLGPLDPMRREMFVSLGCCLENMVLAAVPAGYKVDLDVRPGPLEAIARASGPELVARLDLGAGEKFTSGFFNYILARRTNRGPYQPDVPLSGMELTTLNGMADKYDDLTLTVFVPRLARERLGALIVDATEAIIAVPEMVRATDAWIRPNRAEVAAHRDGLTLDSLTLPPALTALAKMLPAPDAATMHEMWLEATRDVHVATAAALGVVSVENPLDRLTSLRVGRLWQRLHLFATRRGVAMQPLNQPLEMRDREMVLGLSPEFTRRLERLTPNGRTAHFLFRAGFPVRPAAPSPRRSAEEVVLDRVARR